MRTRFVVPLLIITLMLLYTPLIVFNTDSANASASVSVTSAYWQVGGSTVTTVKVGDSVQAKAVITAQGGSISGTWKIEVVKDISWSSDQVMAQASGSVSLESGAIQTISVSWSPDEASGQNSVDGYFIVVYYNSTKIYIMSSRLTVTTATVPTPTPVATARPTATPITTPRPTATATQAAGTLTVSSAYWQVGGSTVTTAEVGDTVLAKAVITAQGGSVSGTWTIKVLKDISWASDEVVAQDSGSTSLSSGGSQTISLSWSPDTASGEASVDGYFVEVWFNGTKIYVMTSYPPRLTVTAIPTASVSVTSAYWQVGSSNVTTVEVGNTVLAKAVIKAQSGSINGTWTLKVIKDVSLAFDQEVAQSSGSVSLNDGASQTISLSWSPDTASGEDSVDGYFVEVWFNGIKIYVMTSYPPRLTVTAVPTASVSVTSAYWQVSSSTVTTAQAGDTILAKAVVIAQGGPVNGTCTIKVAKDIALGLDQDYATGSTVINIAAGKSQTVSFSWSPDAASDEDGLRGYYILIYFDGSKIYTMSDDYPPRLTVSSVPASGATVSNVYWQVGASTVTNAQIGDTVLAKAVVTAQGGRISGSYTIKVSEDIAFSPDVDYAQSSGSLNLAEGGSQTISLSWSPDSASGDGGLRGYYIQVLLNGSSIYSMSADYPPRFTVNPMPTASPTYAPTTVVSLPERFDWREHGILPLIRSQGSCGSCWAFSAVGVVEATYNKEHRTSGTSIDLSEQNLVSNCCGAGSCRGGVASTALSFIKTTGIVDESCFPYQSSGCGYPACSAGCTCSDGTCSKPCSCATCQDWGNRLWKIESYGKVTGTVNEIKKALINHGPLSVASSNWGHAFVLVGYDDNCSVCRDQYGINGCWIIRNSWGVRTGWSSTVWHENGYGYIPYSSHSYSDLIGRAYYVEGVVSP